MHGGESEGGRGRCGAASEAVAVRCHPAAESGARGEPPCRNRSISQPSRTDSTPGSGPRESVFGGIPRAAGAGVGMGCDAAPQGLQTGPPGLGPGGCGAPAGASLLPQTLALGMVEPAARARCRGPAGPTPQERGGGVPSFSRQVSARSQKQPVRCHNRRTPKRATSRRMLHSGAPHHETTRIRRGGDGRGTREQGYTIRGPSTCDAAAAVRPGVLGQDLLKAQGMWDISEGASGARRSPDAPWAEGTAQMCPHVLPASVSHPRTRAPVKGPLRLGHRVRDASLAEFRQLSGNRRSARCGRACRVGRPTITVARVVLFSRS